MNAFIKRIDPAIKESGLSDAEIERRAGIPAKTISKWRHTALKSYVDYIPQLSTVLQKSESYLLGVEEEKPAPTNEDGLTEAQREFIRLVPTLTDRELDVLLSTAKALIAARQ